MRYYLLSVPENGTAFLTSDNVLDIAIIVFAVLSVLAVVLVTVFSLYRRNKVYIVIDGKCYILDRRTGKKKIAHKLSLMGIKNIDKKG